jgi:hypothetical protein
MLYFLNNVLILSLIKKIKYVEKDAIDKSNAVSLYRYATVYTHFNTVCIK